MPSIKSSLQLLSTKFASLALPTSCIVCEVFQEATVCLSCKQFIETEGLFNYECCRQCGIPLGEQELSSRHCDACQASQPHYDETYCLDRYNGVLQTALHQLKYQRRLAFAHGLTNAWNIFMGNALQHCDADYLLPVPLSTQKLCTRGFNQAWEIARNIECGSHIQKLPFALKRHHHDQPQALANRTLRSNTIQNMFFVDPQYLNLLENKKIIVFDDVMTSGATFNEIAKVLKDNGASRVINWTLLRTLKPRK